MEKIKHCCCRCCCYFSSILLISFIALKRWTQIKSTPATVAIPLSKCASSFVLSYFYLNLPSFKLVLLISSLFCFLFACSMATFSISINLILFICFMTSELDTRTGQTNEQRAKASQHIFSTIYFIWLMTILSCYFYMYLSLRGRRARVLILKLLCLPY